MKGAPPKPITPARPCKLLAHQLDRFEHERDVALGLERMQLLDVRAGTDRLMDDRPQVGLDLQ